jgi:hypothetical protein
MLLHPGLLSTIGRFARWARKNEIRECASLLACRDSAIGHTIPFFHIGVAPGWLTDAYQYGPVPLHTVPPPGFTFLRSNIGYYVHLA